MKKSAGFVAAGLVGLVCAAVAVLTSYSLAQSRESGAASATYIHGVLRVAVPFNAPRNGEGDLTVEVLDPAMVKALAILAGMRGA